MRSLILSRTTLVWLALVVATMCSLFTGHGADLDRRQAAIIILVITFVKARFVVLDFMEIRRAPLAMRIVAELWIVCLCIGLIYWL